MNTLQEMIDVMTAARDGKKTLRRQRGKTTDWMENEDFYFNWVDYDYRVKPEPPKPREIWASISEHGDIQTVFIVKPDFWKGSLLTFREVL